MSITNFKNKLETGNFWELNPHILHIEPYKTLYSKDRSKNKEISSGTMWCIFWMTDPDESINKFYRIVDKDERLNICKSIYPHFNEEDELVSKCLERYPYLCMTSDKLAYKLEKDQLVEISLFLSKQTISLDTAKEIIELKAKMPKIYQDFDKTDKLFAQKKSEVRVWGRTQTAREKGLIQPTE